MNPKGATDPWVRSQDRRRNSARFPGNVVPRRRSRLAWLGELPQIAGAFLRHRRGRNHLAGAAAPAERPHILLFTYDLHNLGNQALVFSAVAYLKRHYPHKQIHVLVFRRDRHPAYVFDVHTFLVEDKVRLLRRRAGHPLRGILERSCLAMDVSGLIFSHAMGWKLSIHFLLNLMLAREYGIPFVVYPQTLGPLDFPWPLRPILHALAAAYLPGAEKVFARERAGLDHLRPFGLENLALSPDAVLTAPTVAQQQVYVDGHAGNAPLPGEMPDTIAWVPNVRINERIPPERMRALNRRGIGAALDSGLRVWVICHSPSDRRAGRAAAGLFARDDRVRLLEDPLDAIQMVDLLGRFRFIVSQRYHAIVHALKTHTPAVALSWDDKYNELYARLGLEDFCFDIRRGFRLESVEAAIIAMVSQAEQLHGSISAGLEGLTLQPVWDCLDRVLKEPDGEGVRRPA